MIVKHSQNVSNTVLFFSHHNGGNRPPQYQTKSDTDRKGHCIWQRKILSTGPKSGSKNEM